MNIVVCYKIVPDEQDAVIASDRSLSFERAALKIGDYDLNAVEAGAQLAALHDAKLTCVTIGGSSVEDSKLKKSILARGPVENFAVKDEVLVHAGSTLTARVLKMAIERIDSPDLILCGEGSADLYSQQVGIQLGELMGLPTINAVSAIEIDGALAHVERTVGNQIEKLDVPLPAVLSVVADMNEPRIPSMKDILSAGKKPSTVIDAAELGFADFSEHLETVSTLAPEQKDRAHEIIEGDSEEAVSAFLDKVRAAL